MPFFGNTWIRRYQRTTRFPDVVQLILERVAPQQEKVYRLLKEVRFEELKQYYYSSLETYRWELIRELQQYGNRRALKRAVSQSHADDLEEFVHLYPDDAEQLANHFNVDVEAKSPQDIGRQIGRVLKERISNANIDLSEIEDDLKEQVEENTETLAAIVAANNPFN